MNFIFNEPEEKLPKPQHEFTDDELSLFAALSSSTLQLMIIKGADPDGTRFKNKAYPWKGCFSADACFKKLLDPDDPVIYMPDMEVRYTKFYALLNYFQVNTY